MGFKPLNILILNQPWFVDEFRQWGHTVVTAGRFSTVFDVRIEEISLPIDELLGRLPAGFIPDRIIYYDDSWPVVVHGLEDIGIPTLFYSVDAHHHLDWHSNFGVIFDKVLVALKDYVERFWPICPNAEWFPLWAPVEMVPKEEKTIDVCFRGTLNPELHPERVKFFNALTKIVDVDVRQGPYTSDYPKSKIIINQAVKDDVNFRIFEALASGALLITPRIGNGLVDLFIPGEEIVLYEKGNVTDAAEKIKFYLNNEEERKRIAANGFNKVSRLHSKQARAMQMAQHLENLKVTERPRKYGGSAYVYCQAGTRFVKAQKALAANQILKRAASNIIQSADCGENYGENFLLLALSIKFSLDDNNQFEFVRSYVGELLRRFPDEGLLKTAYLDTLLNLDIKNEVEEYARSVSPHPEEFIAAAKGVLADIRKTIV